MMLGDFEKLDLGTCCLKYCNTQRIEKSLVSNGYRTLVEETQNSDLLTGHYEGGLKLWEGAIDLCHYLDNLNNNIFQRKAVLEVGCGGGLPGILALLKGAKHVSFQDFNASVLECFTELNVKTNLVHAEGRYKLISGNWKDILHSIDKVDIILTAETIYCPDYYNSLHNLLETALNAEGTIFLAAKSYYFGVGGSVGSWIEFVRSAGIFEQTEVWTSESAVPRKIFSLRRKVNLSVLVHRRAM